MKRDSRLKGRLIAFQRIPKHSDSAGSAFQVLQINAPIVEGLADDNANEVLPDLLVSQALGL